MLDLPRVAPIVNLNGTSREELINQIQQANAAINNAIDALMDAMPHGRDYQLNKSGEYEVARGAHLAKIEMLHEIKAHNTLIGLDIINQG